MASYNLSRQKCYSRKLNSANDHLQNKSWGVNDGEIWAMGIFCSHDNWFWRYGAVKFLQKRVCSGFYDICYNRRRSYGISIIFRILILQHFAVHHQSQNLCRINTQLRSFNCIKNIELQERCYNRSCNNNTGKKE